MKKIQRKAKQESDKHPKNKDKDHDETRIKQEDSHSDSGNLIIKSSKSALFSQNLKNNSMYTLVDTAQIHKCRFKPAPN